MRVLVTSFEPFGGEPKNASGLAVDALPAALVGSADELAVRRLPVLFDQAGDVLLQHLEELRPDVTICVGQAGARALVSLERVAVNLDDSRMKDNAGAERVDQPVTPGGPAAYFATLPTRGLLATLEAAEIPAELSYSAGTYVCNHVFYRLMQSLAASPRPQLGGFVHVPRAREQFAGSPDGVLDAAARDRALPLATLVEALVLIVRGSAAALEERA